MYEYKSIRWVVYGGSGQQFIPVCRKCGRFVRADETILVNGLEELSPAPNATCAKCGRTHMVYEGLLG